MQLQIIIKHNIKAMKTIKIKKKIKMQITKQHRISIIHPQFTWQLHLPTQLHQFVFPRVLLDFQLRNTKNLHNQNNTSNGKTCNIL